MTVQQSLAASPPTAADVDLLFCGIDTAGSEVAVPPSTFRDLNLGPLLEAALRGRGEYDLADLYRRPVASLELIEARQAVFRDLEGSGVRGGLNAFAESMRAVRHAIRGAGEAARYPILANRLLLGGAAAYIDAVSTLARLLAVADLRSDAMISACGVVESYVAGDVFSALSDDAEATLRALDGVRYRLRVRDGLVDVSRVDEGEPDYTEEVTELFERFRNGPPRQDPGTVVSARGLDHVEVKIAELVARQHPEAFGRLSRFAAQHQGFLDSRIARFDREMQFYAAYREIMERLHGDGLEFCYPRLVAGTAGESPPLAARRAFDLALACAPGRRQPVVPNDFRLDAGERVLVVSGPNQGGKTTFARMIGQLHYLAALGLPVPGSHAELLLPDGIATLFEEGENLADLRGHLHDDLVRVREMLDGATAQSVIILNEIFTSTSLEDALLLSERILRRVIGTGSLCVFVTFMAELGDLDRSTVSFVAEVDPHDPDTRTFRVCRRAADGLAHAQALTQRHELDPESLRRRLTR